MKLAVRGEYSDRDHEVYCDACARRQEFPEDVTLIRLTDDALCCEVCGGTDEDDNPAE